jgi:hypothetical protein
VQENSSQADSAGLIGPVTHPRSGIGTATKYRNTPPATCYLAWLIAALPCSATNMATAAGSSGRSGVFSIARVAVRIGCDRHTRATAIRTA